jgi:membrane associated rhomboid family serine protease
LIPIRDSQTGVRTIPVFTVLFILLNVAVFVFQFRLGDGAAAFVARFGTIPWEISHFEELPNQSPVARSPFPVLLTLITGMFLHGGLLHLAGNMLYLWIFGDNVEALTGHFRFPFFYLTCGLVASLTHVFFQPESAAPMIGASGAISGILGAYFIRFPKARVHVFVFIPFLILRVIKIPAVLVLGFWFLMQLLNGVGSLQLHTTGGVAWFAHIGGFVAGAVLIFFFQKERGKRYERWG